MQASGASAPVETRRVAASQGEKRKEKQRRFGFKKLIRTSRCGRKEKGKSRTDDVCAHTCSPNIRPGQLTFRQFASLLQCGAHGGANAADPHGY